MHPISPMMSRIFTSDTVSVPSNMPYAMVRTTPVPTQTAYEVPTGSVFNAYPRPTMLKIHATTKIIVGMGCVNPSDLSRAVAHTHSMQPDATRMIQAIRRPSVEAGRMHRLVLTRYDRARRDP